MAAIQAYKGLGITKDILIKNASGANISPQTNDIIRAIIGREGSLHSAPELQISSDADTDSGSYFRKNYPSAGVNRLRLDASDLDFPAGIYTLAIEYFDRADSSEWKSVSREVFNLQDT